MALDFHRQEGWDFNSKKVTRSQALGDCLGAEVDGVSGRVGASRERRLAILLLVLEVTTFGVVTGHLVEILIGMSTHCFLYRRPLLCLQSRVYQCSLGG